MLTPDTIFTAIESVFPVTRADIIGLRRRRNEADARKVACYIIYTYMRYSNAQIAALLGNRSSGSVKDCRDGYLNMHKTDKQFRAMADQVIAILGLNVMAA